MSDTCESHKWYGGPEAPCPHCRLDALEAQVAQQKANYADLFSLYETERERIDKLTYEIGYHHVQYRAHAEVVDNAKPDTVTISRETARLMLRAMKGEDLKGVTSVAYLESISELEKAVGR